MNATVANIDKFHSTRKGKLIFGLVEWLLAYIIISRAIDTGSLWEWLIGLLLIVGGFNNLVRTLFRVKKNAKKSARSR